MLKKNLAGFFAFFLGLFGVHHFYLGNYWRGMAQFAVFWTLVFLVNMARGPGEDFFGILIAASVLLPVITGIVWWATPYEKWAAKHDPEGLARFQGSTHALPAARPNQFAATDGKYLEQRMKQLKAEGKRYYLSGDYDLACEAFEEAVETRPDDPVVRFNLGCCYALLGRYPDALHQLEVAASHGLPDPSRIENHPALRELRKSEAFDAFRANNYRREQLVGEKEASQDVPEPVATQVDAPPAAETIAPDLLEQLARLEELRDAGVLTENEFVRQREKLGA